METTHGADTARLDDVAKGLALLASRTADVAASGASLVGALHEAWAGPDLLVFDAGWRVQERALHQCAEMMQTISGVLRERAEQQRTASEGAAGPLRRLGPAQGPDDPPPPPPVNIPLPPPPGPSRTTLPPPPILGSGYDQTQVGRPAPHSTPDGDDARDPGILRAPKNQIGYEYEWTPDPGPNGPLPKGLGPDDPLVVDLRRTPEGRRRLAWMANNGIAVERTDEPDRSHYDDRKNTIYLGRPHHNSSSILVHEAIHADRDQRDQHSPVVGTPKDVWVRERLTEETDATVAAIEHGKRTRAAGGEAPRSSAEDVYDRAYQETYDRKTAGGATPEEADRAARNSGWSAVRYDYYEEGDRPGDPPGTPRDPSKVHYEKVWDSRNDWNPFNDVG